MDFQVRISDPALAEFEKILAARVTIFHGAMDNPLVHGANPGYYDGMPEAKIIDFDDPVSISDEEDEETLAAIDEGIRDAEAGRTVPIDEVRKLLPQWITA